jgi:hypothetical protein
MDNFGRWTRSCIVIGLTVFIALLLIPGKGLEAIYALLLTPMAATLATACELALRKRFLPATSLLAAVALIVGAIFTHRL